MKATYKKMEKKLAKTVGSKDPAKGVAKMAIKGMGLKKKAK